MRTVRLTIEVSDDVEVYEVANHLQAVIDEDDLLMGSKIVGQALVVE